jgi:hypothetical protein
MGFTDVMGGDGGLGAAGLGIMGDGGTIEGGGVGGVIGLGMDRGAGPGAANGLLGGNGDDGRGGFEFGGLV